MEYLQYFEFVRTRRRERKTVLNLIINGIPSILKFGKNPHEFANVLNLIINGIPSILY